MRLACFLEREDRHQCGQGNERAITQHRPDRKRFGIGKTSAINLQPHRVGADDRDEESQHDQRYERGPDTEFPRSEEHTSELSHGSISYAVFCLKKKKTRNTNQRVSSKRKQNHDNSGPVKRDEAQPSVLHSAVNRQEDSAVYVSMYDILCLQHRIK